MHKVYLNKEDILRVNAALTRRINSSPSESIRRNFVCHERCQPANMHTCIKSEQKIEYSKCHASTIVSVNA